MPRKGENIYKRKDGRWEGRYIRSYDSEHKAKYAYVYGKTYSEVKRKLTEQRGNVQKVQPTKNKSSTYGELLDCWLHSMQLNTKESTQARYTHLIKTHIKPHLGAVQLSQLTTDMKLLKAIFAAMCVGVTLLFLYFENQLSVISLAIAVGFYVVASAIHLVFHECGHFFGGLVSKYKLLFFRFGPFNLVKTEKTKIKFTWLKTHGGQCVMYPSQTSTIKYKAYNLGGVIANAIIAALSTLLMLPNNFYLLMMMIELVFVGAYKILVNLIPHKTNGVPNDGYIVKMLDAHIAMRKDYALYLRIYADTFLNKAISPSDYQYERNESLSDDELLYYNEIQEILKSINAQMSKHEIDHCKGIVI